MCRKERERLDEALLSYHRALAYQEHYPRVQIAISEVYRYQDRPQRALSTLDHLCDRYAPGIVPSEVNYLAAGSGAKGVEAERRRGRKLAGRHQKRPTDGRDAVSVELAANVEWRSYGRAGDGDGSVLALAPQHTNSQRLAAHLRSEQQRLSVAGNPGEVVSGGIY